MTVPGCIPIACKEILHHRQRKVLAFSDRCLCPCDSEFGGPCDPFISLTSLQNAVHLVDPSPAQVSRPTDTLPASPRNRRRPLSRIRQLFASVFSCPPPTLTVGPASSPFQGSRQWRRHEVLAGGGGGGGFWSVKPTYPQNLISPWISVTLF